MEKKTFRKKKINGTDLNAMLYREFYKSELSFENVNESQSLNHFTIVVNIKLLTSRKVTTERYFLHPVNYNHSIPQGGAINSQLFPN